MHKKGAELSLNVIVIAAIVLIVLVVMVVIFSGKIGSFRQGMNNCDTRCVNSASDCSEDATPLLIPNCDANGDGKADGGKYCCKQS